MIGITTEIKFASKLDWYSEAKTVAEMLVLNLKIEKIHLNEWFRAFSSKLCVPEGISFAGSLQTWLICILIILSHFSYFKLIYNWFR